MDSVVYMSLPLINGGDNIENEESKFINMVYNYDWFSTSLGPIDTWDPVLKHVTVICVHIYQLFFIFKKKKKKS